jgi:hypothetical protein
MGFIVLKLKDGHLTLQAYPSQPLFSQIQIAIKRLNIGHYRALSVKVSFTTAAQAR